MCRWIAPSPRYSLVHAVFQMILTWPMLVEPKPGIAHQNISIKAILPGYLSKSLIHYKMLSVIFLDFFPPSVLFRMLPWMMWTYAKKWHFYWTSILHTSIIFAFAAFPVSSFKLCSLSFHSQHITIFLDVILGCLVIFYIPSESGACVKMVNFDEESSMVISFTCLSSERIDSMWLAGDHTFHWGGWLTLLWTGETKWEIIYSGDIRTLSFFKGFF